MGVEDGIVDLEPNDDFAMGASPGAPGALKGVGVAATPRAYVLGYLLLRRRRVDDAEDI